MTSRMKPYFPFSLAVGITLSPLLAAEFQGAESILKQVAEMSGNKAAATGETNPAIDLAKKIKALETAAATLSPDEAALQWLDCFDAYRRMSSEMLEMAAPANEGKALSLKTLVTALPPSAAWDKIVAGMETRAATEPEKIKSTLHLFATILGNDNPARLKAIDAVQATVTKSNSGDSSFNYYANNYGEQLRDAVVSIGADPKQTLETFEKRLKAAESPSKRNESSSDTTLVIPDLVKLAGAEKAAQLLDRAVVLNVNLDTHDEQMHKACVEATTRNISRLKKPQWDLVQGYEELPLYEAMAKRFPRAKDDYTRRDADRVYLIGLIASGRTKEADEFLTERLSDSESRFEFFNDHTFERMNRDGLGKKLISFLEVSLTRNPALPLWEGLSSLSLLEGQSASLLTFLEKMLAKPGLEPSNVAELRSTYLKALLAVGRIDEAIALLKTELHADTKNAGDTDEAAGTRLGQGIQLMKIGRLLKKPELIDEGMAAAKDSLQKLPKRDYETSSAVGELTDELIALDRGAEAEGILSSNLLTLVQFKAREHSYEIKETLTALVSLYDKTKRPEDVLFLLDHSPAWAVSDLTQLSAPLPVIAARALTAVGRNEEAGKIVRRVVQDNPGDDSGYELLLKLGGDDIPALLDNTYSYDRFEERPLIWKARLQLDQGKTEEAEKTIRAAIAVDPSDGEQGKGDRLRAYSVLANVLEKKGDTDQSASVRKAVKAIRLSEDADDWYAAGLLSRAVAMYEESLGYFSDAYCIQSRLARRQSELGDFEKAAEHYRRAFELMPDSFGRVESHCFGCEGTFSDPKAQTTAEKVFATLTEKLPDRPQVFYLYGYLKEEQDKPAEAAVLFQNAVKLDPDYLNAWIHLSSAAEAAGLPPTERDDIMLKIARLDPKGNHGSSSFKGFSDLRRLWDNLLALDQSQPSLETGPLYPLAASKLAMDEKAKKTTDSSDPFEGYSSRENPYSRESFREKFQENPMIDASLTLLEQALHKE
ncbi:MAG: tetratricopeptide repeat protein [Luteolibacter sp.]